MAIQAILTYAEAQRNNKAAYVSSTVADILNKPARTVDAFVKDHIAMF